MATSRAAPADAVRRRAIAPLLSGGQTRLLLRLVAAGAAAVAVKSFVIDPLTGHFGGAYDDFGEYLRTARSIAAGGSPYAGFSAATPVSAGFVYPPFAAVLVRPLALLSDPHALSIWLALSLAATIAAAIIAARVTLPSRWPRVELALLAALAFAPITYNYWHGQINGLIFLLLAAGLWAYVSGRQVTVGLALGLAAGIKVAPIVLLVLLIRRGWWRAAVAMTLTGVATIAIGLALLGGGATRMFFTTVLPALSRPTGWIYNQGLPGAIARVATQSVLRMTPAPVVLVLACAATGVAVVGVAVWAVRSGERTQTERSAEFGLGVVAMLLAGSLVEFAHFTALVIPLFAACGLAAERGWRTERPLLVTVAAAVVAFGVVAPEVIGLLATPGAVSLEGLSHTAWWWPFLQLCSLPGLVALWFGVRLRASLRASAAAPRVRARGLSPRDDPLRAGRGVAARPQSRKGCQAS